MLSGWLYRTATNSLPYGSEAKQSKSTQMNRFIIITQEGLETCEERGRNVHPCYSPPEVGRTR